MFHWGDSEVGEARSVKSSRLWVHSVRTSDRTAWRLCCEGIILEGRKMPKNLSRSPSSGNFSPDNPDNNWHALAIGVIAEERGEYLQIFFSCAALGVVARCRGVCQSFDFSVSELSFTTNAISGLLAHHVVIGCTETSMQAGQWCSMQYAEYVDVSIFNFNSFPVLWFIFLFLHQEEFEINYYLGSLPVEFLNETVTWWTFARRPVKHRNWGSFWSKRCRCRNPTSFRCFNDWQRSAEMPAWNPEWHQARFW